MLIMKAHLEIDRTALRKNIKTLINKNGNAFFCPILKADAYGHGALEIAKIIQSVGVNKIGFSSIEEAIQMKDLIGLKIYIFGPYNEQKEDLTNLIDTYGFIPVVGRWSDLKALSHSKKKSITFHLKFNTGMNRFGFASSEKMAIANFIKKHPILKLKGIASQLSRGEQAASNDNLTNKQIQIFKDIHHYFQNTFSTQKIHTHLLNSAGWLAFWSHSLPDFSLGFRPGSCLYGLQPSVVFSSKEAIQKCQSLDLKPVSRLASFIVHSFTLPPQQYVSYGKTWRTKKHSTLAVVSMGYADGLPYQLFNTGEVLFRGERVPIVGHICMDFFTIDVTAAAKKREIVNGEEVVIFGQQKNNFIPIEEHSYKIKSIPEEILTRLGRQVHRIYKN